MNEQFTLKIEIGNDAMQNNEDIVQALHSVIAKLESGSQYGNIKDINGNTVGNFSL